ncbi:MAG TPA: hypothetical protein GX530_08120 [Corynebacteriales bacterium]|nr:hypothetical protein [Mycobacteriales bacterium]
MAKKVRLRLSGKWEVEEFSEGEFHKGVKLRCYVEMEQRTAGITFPISNPYIVNKEEIIGKTSYKTLPISWFDQEGYIVSLGLNKLFLYGTTTGNFVPFPEPYQGRIYPELIIREDGRGWKYKPIDPGDYLPETIPTNFPGKCIKDVTIRVTKTNIKSQIYDLMVTVDDIEFDEDKTEKYLSKLYLRKLLKNTGVRQPTGEAYISGLSYGFANAGGTGYGPILGSDLQEPIRWGATVSYVPNKEGTYKLSDLVEDTGFDYFTESTYQNFFYIDYTTVLMDQQYIVE